MANQESNEINLSLLLQIYSLYYAEACSDFAGPISTSLRPGNTAPFEEMLQRWRADGNSVPNLISPRFDSQTSSSRDERAPAQPTGRSNQEAKMKIEKTFVELGKSGWLYCRIHANLILDLTYTCQMWIFLVSVYWYMNKLILTDWVSITCAPVKPVSHWRHLLAAPIGRILVAGKTQC